MKIIPYISGIFIPLALALMPLSVNAISAVNTADMVVTCQNEGADKCYISSEKQTLFNEGNILPGSVLTRSFDVVNNRNKECNLFLSGGQAQDTAFTRALHTAIWSSSQNYLGSRDELDNATSQSSLADVLNSGASLGTVASGAANTYKWNVKFDPEAGNDLQDAKATFDFNLTFTCEKDKESEDNGSGSSGSHGSGGGGDEQVATVASPKKGRVAGASTKGSVLGMSQAINTLKAFPVTGAINGFISTNNKSGWFSGSVIQLIIYVLALIFVLLLTWLVLLRRD